MAKALAPTQLHLFILTCLVATSVHAQIDPSSALLLNGSAHSSSRDNGVDSGRYTVRPRTDAPRSKTATDESAPKSRLRTVESTNTNSVAGTSQTTQAPAPSPAAPAASNSQSQIARTESASPLPAPSAPVQVVAVPAAQPQSTATESAVVKAAPAVIEASPVVAAPAAATNSQVENSQAEDDAIRRQVAHDRENSPRVQQNNLLDLSFSAGYLYNDSSSTYSFRKYSTSAPAVAADARIWLSPEFGVGGSYLTTLSGSLPDGSNPARVVPTTQQTMTLGIRYRDFFTRDLSYPYLVWGADYYQYHLSVPQDAQTRADLYTTGAKLSVLGVFPSRRSYAWNLGFALLPKMYHHEGSNAAGFNSGGHADANAVEFLVGGQWQLSPASSMFWRVTYLIEKDLFTGDASVPDPSTKTTPNGVSVTNSTVLLQMGYGWGN